MSENNGKMDLHTLVARIDERTQLTQADIKEIKETLPKMYVSKEEFKPVKNLVFGAVKVVLITVLGAILYFVIKH